MDGLSSGTFSSGRSALTSRRARHSCDTIDSLTSARGWLSSRGCLSSRRGALALRGAHSHHESSVTSFAGSFVTTSTYTSTCANEVKVMESVAGFGPQPGTEAWFFDSEVGARIWEAECRSVGSRAGTNVVSYKQTTTDSRLVDNFDDKGAPQGWRFGLPQALTASTAIRVETQAKGELFSARAYMQAKEAVERDVRRAARRSRENKHRVYVDDVEQRNLNLLFCEISNFHEFLPEFIWIGDILPREATRTLQDDVRAKRQAERLVNRFADARWVDGAKEGWLLSQAEVLELNKIMELWARGIGHSPTSSLWMSRPCFCRFLLDICIVDQRDLPYFWAVSLFDSVSCPVPVGSLDPQRGPSCPTTKAVNRWTMMAVMDIFIRQQFGEKLKGSFMEKVRSAAKRRFPESSKSILVTETLSESVFKGTRRPSVSNSSPPQTPTKSVADTFMGLEELGVSAVDSALVYDAREKSMIREQAARDSRVLQSLIEPEVLHLAQQHLELFSRIHGCYADERGHVSFTALLQLCGDFLLCPAFAACEFMRTTYESVRCYQLPGTVCSMARVPNSSSSTPPPVAGKEEREEDSDEGSSSHARQKTKRQSNLVAQPETVTVASGSVIERKLQRSVSKSRHPSRRSPLGSVTESAERGMVIFGVNALIEVLCRLAFTYLGYYGNHVQQSSSGYARFVWLLVYIAHVASERVKRNDGLDSRSAAALQAAYDLLVIRWSVPPHMCTFRGRQAGCLCPPVGPGRGSGFVKLPARRNSKSLSIVGHDIVRQMAFGKTPNAQSFGSKVSLVPSASECDSAAEEDSTDPDLHADATLEKHRGIREKFADSQGMKEARRHITLPRLRGVGADGAEDSAGATCTLGENVMQRADENLLANVEKRFLHQGGRPYVHNGECGICGRSVEDGGGWGNPMCYGCSFLDGQDLSRCAFQGLVEDLGPGQARPLPKMRAKREPTYRMDRNSSCNDVEADVRKQFEIFEVRNRRSSVEFGA